MSRPLRAQTTLIYYSIRIHSAQGGVQTLKTFPLLFHQLLQGSQLTAFLSAKYFVNSQLSNSKFIANRKGDSVDHTILQ